MSSAAAITAGEISDLVLVRRYLEERDESAFSEIVRRYAGMVYAACFRVLHDRQLAEDATQETFLKLMRRPGNVSLSLGGWLHHAATQMAIDVSRSESARRRREKVHQQSHEELLDDQRCWREISEVIDRALLELEDAPRDLLVQHFILGRPQKQIAEQSGVSVATVCRRVNDATDQLRAVLRRGGMSMGMALLAGDFMALRGTEEIALTLQQELGKMTLLAGVRRGWRLVRTEPRGMSILQVKELEMVGLVIAAAAALILTVLLVLGYLKRPAKAPPNHEHAPTAMVTPDR